MLLVLLAALLGLFGNGPLSRTYAVDPRSPVGLEYDRFARQNSPARLRILLWPGSTRGEPMRLKFDHRFLQGVRIQRITPDPDSAEIGPEGVYYHFRTTGDALPMAVEFHYHPESMGTLAGRVGLGDGPPVRFEQFVYP